MNVYVLFLQMAAVWLVLRATPERPDPPAPTATGSRTVAIRQLSDALRPLHSQIVDYFPLGDVEAEAKLFVGFHAVGRWRQMPRQSLAGVAVGVTFGIVDTVGRGPVN